MPIIEVESLSKTYRKGRTTVPVFNGLSFTAEAGEFVALLGPSGTGKTTMLNLLAGFDRPTAGRIRIDGRDPSSMPEAELGRWRLRTVGFVFQSFNLISTLTAAENVEVPLRNLGLASDARRRHVATALRLVGLDDRAGHFPHELSGGEEQRVGIARAFVTDPKVLIADEPTGNLDAAAAERVMEIFRALNGEQGKTIVLVTHDAHAASFARRTVRLRKGDAGAELAPAAEGTERRTP